MVKKLMATGFVVAFAALLVGSSFMCAINATATYNSPAQAKIL